MVQKSYGYNPARSLLIWGIGDIYFILAVMISVLFAVLSPDIKTQLHLSDVQLGLLGSVFFLCYGIAQVITGRFFDVFGSRWTLGVSALLAASGLALMGISNSFLLAMISKALAGMGLSTSYIGAIYLADKWFPNERFAFFSGVTQMSANLLTAVLVIILALKNSFMNFRYLMFILAFIILLVAILMTLVVRDPSSKNPARQETIDFLSALRRLLKIKQYILGLCYFTAGFGVLLALSDLWNIPAQIAYRHSSETSAMLNAMFPLGAGTGALVSGWLADWMKRPTKIARFFITGMIVLTGLLIYGPDFSTATAFILLFVQGFFFGGAVLGFPIVSQYVPAALKGMAFGFMAMCAYLLSAALQSVIGWILSDVQLPLRAATINDFQVALSPLFIVLVAGWVISMGLRDK
ncbi:Sugar phosphate permease [Legionella spiritensis]|nr:Sugar phosphate permease [Legionella spiritensis]